MQKVLPLQTELSAHIILQDIIELRFQVACSMELGGNYRDTRTVPFLILIVTGFGISKQKRMCESIIMNCKSGAISGVF